MVTRTVVLGNVISVDESGLPTAQFPSQTIASSMVKNNAGMVFARARVASPVRAPSSVKTVGPIAPVLDIAVEGAVFMGGGLL